MISIRNSLPINDELISSLSPKKYSRSFIQDDEELRPYELVGNKRIIYLAIYGLIIITAIVGTFYVLYINPIFALLALAVGYLVDNLKFALGHLEFHTAFIEIPEKKMGTLCHNSFIHHYRNTHVYHEKWLETRISYFLFEPKLELNFRSFVKPLMVLLILATLAFITNPFFAIAFYTAQAVPALLQSVVHEWYHNPRAERKNFYSFPVYWILTLLEKMSIASTKTHMIHHQQGLNNLEKVDQWLDLYIPFGELLPTFLWRKALALHEPGKFRMNNFIRKYASLGSKAVLRGIALLITLQLYYLIVK